MRKDIYIIRNKINEKVYIGQAIDTLSRFKSHKSRTRTNSDNSPIHDAMNTLGIENFYVEILEKQVENYNERERYWIKHFNSLVPNGYNLLEGGEEPPYHKGEACTQAILTEQQVKEIKELLSNSNIPMQDLATKYSVTLSVIRHINYGESWKDEYLNYPLRKQDGRESIFEINKISQICWLLQNSTCSMEDIGQYYNTNRKMIAKINNGTKYKNDIYQYPLRTKRYRNKQTIQEALLKMKEVNNEL